MKKQKSKYILYYERYAYIANKIKRNEYNEALRDTIQKLNDDLHKELECL